SKIVVRLGEIGVELNGAAKQRRGLFHASLIAHAVAEVEPCQSEPGAAPDQFAQLRLGRRELPAHRHAVRDPHLELRLVGTKLARLLESRLRFLEAAQLEKRHREIAAERPVPWLQIYGLSDERHRLLGSAALERGESEQVERVRLARIYRKSLFVKGF